MFGVLTMHLARLINYGHLFDGVEELYNVLVEFPLQHSFFHLFRPKRNALSLAILPHFFESHVLPMIKGSRASCE